VGTRKTFAAEVRKLATASAQKISCQQKKAAREAAAGDRKLKREGTMWAKTYFPKAKAQIRNAASGGERIACIRIVRWEREFYPKWAQYRAEALKKLLQKEGLVADHQCRKMDPYENPTLASTDTVYDLHLEVIW